MNYKNDKKVVEKKIKALCEKIYAPVIIDEEYLSYLLHKYENHLAYSPHGLQQIFPMIILYHCLCKNMPREQALEKINFAHNQALSFPARKFIVKMLKVPFLYKLFPKLAGSSTTKKFGESHGFKAIVLEKNSSSFKYHISKCPYDDICRAEGYPELTNIFCTSDEICYENIHPKLIFAREQTLGRNGEKCDFHFYLKK